MDALTSALKKIFFVISALLLSSCQLSYYLKSAKGQISLLSSRTSIEKTLADPEISEEEKKKIRLAQEAKEFAETKIGLKKTHNYTSYVKLNRSAVTYVVSAANRWELKHHQWKYPIVGTMPYKGFFDEADAKQEEKELQSQNLDTYLRGVSAYSTLGWFNDPILSSMVKYKDHDLVNTIIHETVHGTLYIKNSADFNERLAVFIGNKATEDFYRQREGPGSPTLKVIQNENEDDRLFSQFISLEIKALENWYKEQKDQNEDSRKNRIRQIQEKFKTELLPLMKSDQYKKFPEIELNNARILVYKTYVQDLSDFEKLFELSDSDYQKFLDHCQGLESHPKPEEGLRELVQTLTEV
ncbi:MAG: aminopeptidase [Oligoflexia bacterium]|nr:MAG: aminopeptidase [Oligoflexia bacterium]